MVQLLSVYLFVYLLFAHDSDTYNDMTLSVTNRHLKMHQHLLYETFQMLYSSKILRV